MNAIPQANLIDQQNSAPKDLFTNLFDTTTTPLSTTHVKHNQEFPQRSFPSVNTFSIDIDPFSSTAFQSNPFDDNFVKTTTSTHKTATNPFVDPFEIGEFNSQDPFSVFNTVTTTNTSNKMTSINEDVPLDFSKADEFLAESREDEEKFEIKNLDLVENQAENPEFHFNERPIDLGEGEEVTGKKNNYAFGDDSSSSEDEFNLPSSMPKKLSVDIVEIRDSFSEHNPDESAKPKVLETKEEFDDDENNEDDDMDGAFNTFKHEIVKPVEDLPSLANEIKFDDFDINNATGGGGDFDEQMNLAMRKGDTNFEVTVNGFVFDGDVGEEDENEKEKVSKLDSEHTKSTLKTAEDVQIEEDDSTVSPYVNSSPLFNRGDTKINKDSVESSPNGRSNNGLPDLINQPKGKNQSTNDKARKFLEGLDGVKFNEIQVPDVLKKQLEFFDRDELLQLIAYQKKYLDYKESRIKDLENYIDNLVVKIIETEPLILMNASNVLNKSTKLV